MLARLRVTATLWLRACARCLAGWLHLGCTLAAPFPALVLAAHRGLDSSQDCHCCIPGPPRMRSKSPASVPLALRWSTTHSGGCAPLPAALASHAHHPPRRLTRRPPGSASGRHQMTRRRCVVTARLQVGKGAIRRTLTTWQSSRTREAYCRVHWRESKTVSRSRLYIYSLFKYYFKYTPRFTTEPVQSM